MIAVYEVYGQEGALPWRPVKIPDGWEIYIRTEGNIEHLLGIRPDGQHFEILAGNLLIGKIKVFP